MVRLAWCTDIHLDFMGDDGSNKFFERIKLIKDIDGYVITGDITISVDLREQLIRMEHILNKPVYFVLGNHDYYYSTLTDVRRLVQKCTSDAKNIVYLAEKTFIKLSSDTAIVGHDCWYDARLGDPYSGFAMNDWRHIEDFNSLRIRRWEVKPNENIIALARCLADEGAFHIETGIEAAIKDGCTKIITVSHVPPFPEAHRHEGERGSNGTMSWYTCKALGDVLAKCAENHPNVQFTSLSGHTHGAYDGRRENIHVLVGGAEYEKPDVVGIIEV